MKDPDWGGFIDALCQATVLHRRKELVDVFRHQYKQELFVLLDMLERVGIVGADTSLHIDPPTECDLCGSAFSHHRWFIDGGVDGTGAWANMCPSCFVEKGHSIGWGSGQLYLNAGEGRWRLVAGGDPVEDHD